MFIVANAEKQLSHSVNTLSDYTDKINQAIYDIKKSYVYIGGLLNEINSFETYKELGYENIAEYCEKTFGFKKTFTYDLMNVQRKFNNGTIFNLDERYKNYDFSKLVVMSRMNDMQLSKCSSDMTVQQIKDIKRNIYPCTYEYYQEQEKQNSARAEHIKELEAKGIVVNYEGKSIQQQNDEFVFSDSARTENRNNWDVLYDSSFFALDDEDLEMASAFFGLNIQKGKYRVVFLPYETD